MSPYSLPTPGRITIVKCACCSESLPECEFARVRGSRRRSEICRLCVAIKHETAQRERRRRAVVKLAPPVMSW
jgi:hypothetical protein